MKGGEIIKFWGPTGTPESSLKAGSQQGAEQRESEISPGWGPMAWRSRRSNIPICGAPVFAVVLVTSLHVAILIR